MRPLGRSFLLNAALLLGVTTLLGDGGRLHRDPQAPPIKLGTSGSRIDDTRTFPQIGGSCYAATLGSAVLCNGALAILSNNHVLAETETGVAPPGVPVVQPGLRDVACKETATVVADFAGDLVPFFESNVDAAIAFAREGAVDPLGEILDIGVPCATPRAPEIGLPVAKSGRTTGLTFGTVTRLNLTVTVFHPDGGTVVKTNQFEMRPGNPEFVKQGDSGSLVVTDDASHQPVGLLWAVGQSTTIASTAADLIDAFTPHCRPGGFAFAGRACATAAAATSRLLGPPPAEVAFATMVKERHEGRLLREPGVVGVGIGAAPSNPNEAVIFVLLERPPDGRAHIPGALDGVKVLIDVTGPFHRL